MTALFRRRTAAPWPTVTPSPTLTPAQVATLAAEACERHARRIS